MLKVLDQVDQPIVSLQALQAIGFPTTVGPSGSGLDPFTFLRQVMLANGLNFIKQVNDCETAGDWTESEDTTWDVEASASTGKRVGTNALKLTATATCDGTQFVQTLFINGSKKLPISPSRNKAQQDWRDTRYLGFWLNNQSIGDFSTAGEMLVTIVVDGVEQTQVNVQALTDDVFQWFEVDMVASGWDRHAVESLRFYANVASGEDIYIDDILRYEISYDRGPLYGCAFPITSGTALINGNHCGWTVDGLAALSSSSITSLGTVKLFNKGAPVVRGGTLTGNGARERWGFFPGQFIYISRASTNSIVAGEGVEVAAAGTIAGVATTVDEKAHAKALEGSNTVGDDIFVLAGTDTSNAD